MQNISIVQSSLNLRIEKGMRQSDYVLSKEIAEAQLKFGSDIYCNVEFMECNNESYLRLFEQSGYKPFTSLDKNGRGILCEIKDTFTVEKIGEMSNPHMLHLRVKKESNVIELITIRLLVSNGGDEDFKDRKQQWDRILSYIDKIKNTSNIILTGDFNHGVISNYYRRDQPRRFYNYQMVVNSLREKSIELFPIDGFSFRGYMRIDHIATGKSVQICSADYVEVFKEPYEIGIPDHSFIVAKLETM